MIYRKRRKLQNPISISKTPQLYSQNKQIIENYNKENKAKKVLMQLEEHQHPLTQQFRYKDKKKLSINGWIPLKIQQQLQLKPQENNKNIKPRNYHQRLQSMIPKLKDLLKQLESPKNITKNRKHQLRMEILKEFHQKKKQPCRIADIIKINMNSRKTYRQSTQASRPFLSERTSKVVSVQRRQIHTAQQVLKKTPIQIQMQQIKQARKKRTLKNLLL